MNPKFADKEIKSLHELMTAIKENTAGLKEPVWYRGHYDVDWKLVPTLHRGDHESELNLLKRFRQDATLLLNPRPKELYDWLFIMRHHEVPTRLLDWTESPLVGLFFTVNEKQDKNGALWVLLPHQLNKQNGRDFQQDKDILPSFEEDDAIMNSYRPETFSIDKGAPLLPIAFVAPRNNQRMQSQLSVFTINHKDKTPIEDIGDGKHVWRYIIPATAKKSIMEELSLIKINRFQLFPELDSIGRALNGE
jgi:hypothetical protein